MAEGRPVPNRRAIQRWGALLAGLLLAMGLSLPLPMPGGGAAAGAAERQLELKGFQMVAEVARDGSVQVSETLTAHFQGKWNGLRRQIPVLANRPDGIEPLGLTLLSASDEAGHPYRTETRRLGGDLDLRIFVPGAEDATRTVVLRYRVRNGVRFYPDHDELNWNVTGNAWEIPIDRVSARVQLPEGVQGLHASVYTGPLGSRGQDARLAIGEREVTAVSSRRLEPGEGLTLAVGFDKGLVTPRSALQRALGWLQGRLALLLPLVTGLILGRIWWLFGRDPALGSVPVVYEPPGGLPAAVLGSLAQESVGSESLGATLVDLAVKGHLRIKEVQEKVLLLPVLKHYRFTLLTTTPQWKDLAPHEVYLLERLFPSRRVGESVDTRELRDHFYVHVPGFEKLVREAVLEEGFYRRWPGTVRSVTLLAGIGAAVVSVVLAKLLLPHDLSELQAVADPLLTGLALLATLVLIIVFAWIMPSRTIKGVEVLRQILGFQEFLRRVDAPRFKKVILTPELFERFLPYAMVAGLTKHWAAAFQGIVESPPSWYQGSGDHFDIGGFGSSIDDCCSTTGSAMQSSPSSSSSSGSSGGGSSGGGDGGGGGGGF
ncbi:DUF2207 domain-containing protein [Synechococcus sp. GFB01]|uniref:DUF2207 domain-containing protein n=1 Tax=Synechococcus sp. GFB01 TaxID=1662190 RepID=UPI00064F29DB|nr:DUF2207 domain-containing protein [Synechococcus sp. GFB01]KMM17406.1 hypothetical protein SYNGFB01_04290 [Synechococcus sp. GFB01]